MKELEEILNKIDECTETYELMPLTDTLKQSDILRTLTAYLSYLEKHRVDAYNNWMEVYYTCKQTSNAAKKQWADNEVKELYLIRRVSDAGYQVVNALRSTISIYKKEG